MPDITNNVVTVQPGGGSSAENVTEEELQAAHDDAVTTAEAYSDSALSDYDTSTVQPISDAVDALSTGVGGIAISEQYSGDINTAAGNLTVHDIFIDTPEIATWPEWTTIIQFVGVSGVCAVGSVSTPGGGSLHLSVVSLAPAGTPQLLEGTFYVYIIGRP